MKRRRRSERSATEVTITRDDAVCPHCLGVGAHLDDACLACDGEGELQREILVGGDVDPADPSVGAGPCPSVEQAWFIDTGEAVELTTEEFDRAGELLVDQAAEDDEAAYENAMLSRGDD